MTEVNEMSEECTKPVPDNNRATDIIQTSAVLYCREAFISCKQHVINVCHIHQHNVG